MNLNCVTLPENDRMGGGGGLQSCVTEHASPHNVNSYFLFNRSYRTTVLNFNVLIQLQ